MPLTMKTLAAREIPTSPTTIYTVGAGVTTRVQELLLSNNAGASRTVQVWFRSASESRTDAMEISGGGIEVDRGVPFAIGLSTILETGATIDVDADGADVAVRISGIEQS